MKVGFELGSRFTDYAPSGPCGLKARSSSHVRSGDELEGPEVVIGADDGEVAAVERGDRRNGKVLSATATTLRVDKTEAHVGVCPRSGRRSVHSRQNEVDDR